MACAAAAAAVPFLAPAPQATLAPPVPLTCIRMPCLHCPYCLPVLQIWVYGNSLESSLVAVVVPKKSFLEKYSDLASPEATKAMLQVGQKERRGQAGETLCLPGCGAEDGWRVGPCVGLGQKHLRTVCPFPCVPPLLLLPAAGAAERGAGRQAQGL